MTAAFAAIEARANAAVMRRLANETATAAGGSFPVIFDREHVEVLSLAGGVDATQPVATAADADLQAAGVTVGTALTIASTTYYVQRPQSDGRGLTRLVLTLEPA